MRIKLAMTAGGSLAKTAGRASPPSIAQAISAAAARLDRIADNPRLEARLLLAHALGLSQNDLIRDPGRAIDTGAFEALVGRRIAHEPIAHILGHREFWSLDFQVSPDTLIPRPDSETLVEAALAGFADRPAPARILDLGTGTGCLLLALMTEFPAAFGIGLDLAPRAAALAKLNADRLGLADRCGFVVGDWTDALSGRFDLVVSNPPYIRRADIDGLMPEVALHEPRSALDGGIDGCDAYRTIVLALRRHLAFGGVGVLELGFGQANYVCDITREAGFHASCRLDLAGNPRALVVTWPD